MRCDDQARWHASAMQSVRPLPCSPAPAYCPAIRLFAAAVIRASSSCLPACSDGIHSSTAPACMSAACTRRNAHTRASMHPLCLPASCPPHASTPEVPQQALDGPGCCVAQGANGVAFNLLDQRIQHVHLAQVCVAVHAPPQDVVQPAAALAAGRALTARLVPGQGGGERGEARRGRGGAVAA